jgi:spermidine synthase
MKKKFFPGKSWFFEDIKIGNPHTYTWGVFPKKNIYSGKSKFQKIEIFETEKFGRILTLDGFTQLSTEYEFIYHEMLTHPAIFYHPKPENVLIIGGGDGGILREVAKHPVKEICLVDLDEKVIEVSEKYLPSVSRGAFGDKRLVIFNVDALKFVKKYRNYFDVIINDLTDPAGPSLALWNTSFFKDIAGAMRKNGIASFQTAFFEEANTQKNMKNLRRVFPYFKVHKAFVNYFPFGEHTFSLGSKDVDFNRVNVGTIRKRFQKVNPETKYYSPEIHFSSQVLPRIFKNFH